MESDSQMLVACFRGFYMFSNCFIIYPNVVNQNQRQSAMRYLYQTSTPNLGMVHEQ
jgi:hypothetical protein